MRIRIENTDIPDLHLRLPNALALNTFTAQWLHKAGEEHHVHLTRGQILSLMRAARRYSRKHPDWVLVDVQDKDNTHIQVTL